MSGMTPQHPAAPETETEAIVSRCLDAARERVRVVEGERDAARGDLVFSRQTTTNLMEALADSGAETLAAIARAESAEAAHERLRAGLEALATKWKRHAEYLGLLGNENADDHAETLLTDYLPEVEELLGGGEAR